MKNPGVHISLVRLFCAVFFALSVLLRAEPPNSSDSQPGKVRPGSRTKPQVIYHLRPASNYAARLHSQEKTQNNEPVDNDMPTSPQLPRPNANTEARPQQEATPRERAEKRPRMQKNRSARPHFSEKSKGHGDKGHKH